MEQRRDSLNRNILLDLIYPPRCVFCRKLTAPGDLDICGECKRNLPQPPPTRRGEFFSACCSVVPYEEPYRDALLRMKMGGKTAAVSTLGRMMAAQIQQEFDGAYDLITWVPISFQRRLKRGFDQDKLLAREVAKVLRKPLLPLLRKVRNNRAQSSLQNAAARRGNVLNAYKAIRKQEIIGKRVLLIDDVITTGATLSECSRVLLTAGAAQVLCATFAATKPKQ